MDSKDLASGWNGESWSDCGGVQEFGCSEETDVAGSELWYWKMFLVNGNEDMKGDKGSEI